MKLKIQVYLLDPHCSLSVNPKGDLIDVKTRVETKMTHLDYQKIPLGAVIVLPKGCKADLKMRSSTFEKWGIIMANGIGTMDWTYRGIEDEWKLPALCLRKTQKQKYVIIPRYTKIAQFEVTLSPRATFWQKLRFMLSDGFEIEYIDASQVTGESRGGFGKSGER